jgi:hypothetical protein
VPPLQLIGAFTGHLLIMLALVVISVLKPWGQRRRGFRGAAATP